MSATYERYAKIRDMLGYTDYKVAKGSGIGTATMSNWKNNVYTPKTDKLQKVAEFLGVDVREIIGDDSSESSSKLKYYLNDETAQVAQEIFENRELRVLFDAARDASPEDLQTTYNMLMALKKKERGYNDDDAGC